MISRLTLTALALTAGATAASSSSFSSNTHTGPTSTSTVLSFAYPAQAYYASAYIPTEGISAQVYAVDESSRTTLAFTCPSSQSTTGALCPQETNTPVAVTVGPDYFAWNWYRSYDSAYFAPQTTLASDARVEGELHCAVTSTKTKASPVCTVNVTSIAAPLQTAAVMEDMRCFEEDIAGPASELAQGVYVSLFFFLFPRPALEESDMRRDFANGMLPHRTRFPWEAASLPWRLSRLRRTRSREMRRMWSTGL